MQADADSKMGVARKMFRMIISGPRVRQLAAEADHKGWASPLQLSDLTSCPPTPPGASGSLEAPTAHTAPSRSHTLLQFNDDPVGIRLEVEAAACNDDAWRGMKPRVILAGAYGALSSEFGRVRV